MADKNWRDSTQIMACKELCQKFDRRQAIIILIDDEGRIQGASYGQTGELCTEAGRLLDSIIDKVFI